MAFDCWTKFTGSKNRDIYPPSRRSRACARDPATLLNIYVWFIEFDVEEVGCKGR
jgi:hypothetical protein